MSKQALLWLCMACATLNIAWGHGYLAMPRSRNLISNSDWCPHCLNGGGAAMVAGGGWFPNGKGGAGLCGDPGRGPLKHQAGGSYAKDIIPPANVYQQGQVVALEVLVSAFHKGRFGFRICKISSRGNNQAEAEQLTEACLDSNTLVQADVPEAQNPGDVWFHLGQTNVGTPCPRGTCQVQGTLHTSYFQLPKDLHCDGVGSKCVLQWYYLTGNSCNPPGEGAPWGSTVLATCGQGTSYPEEFWNCADIIITPRNTTGDPPSPTPPTSPTPSPVASPLPTPSPPDSNSTSPSPDPTTSPDPSPEPSPEPSPQPSPQPSPSPDPYPDNPPNITSPAPEVPPPPYPDKAPRCRPGQAKCICKWLGRDGFYPEIRRKCKFYYMCSQGKAFRKKCPRNPTKRRQKMRFSYDTHSCGIPSDVECPANYRQFLEAVTPPPTPPPAAPSPPPPADVSQCRGTPEDCAFCSTKPATTAVSTFTASGCTGFYTCQWGVNQNLKVARFFPCAPGTLFSPATARCEWPSNVMCPVIPSYVELRTTVAMARVDPEVRARRSRASGGV